MSTQKTVLATLFVTAMALTCTAQAQESHVERVINSMVNTAMQSAQAEINEEVQKSILASAYNLGFAKALDPTAPATTVTITDIASVQTNTTSQDQEVNLTEKSDD
ncbi:MAG: GH24 family phage-related lysozyme (muramidase) [Arenicella sp.]|jgi:GH24 family phage-related lysozyme (muramidase)